MYLCRCIRLLAQVPKPSLYLSNFSSCQYFHLDCHRLYTISLVIPKIPKLTISELDHLNLVFGSHLNVGSQPTLFLPDRYYCYLRGKQSELVENPCTRGKEHTTTDNCQRKYRGHYRCSSIKGEGKGRKVVKLLISQKNTWALLTTHCQ